MKRGEIEEKRDRDRVVRELHLFWDKFWTLKLHLFWNGGVHIRKWFHSPFICPPSVPPITFLPKRKSKNEILIIWRKMSFNWEGLSQKDFISEVSTAMKKIKTIITWLLICSSFLLWSEMTWCQKRALDCAKSVKLKLVLAHQNTLLQKTCIDYCLFIRSITAGSYSLCQ